MKLKYLFNPFEKVAGWRALLLGLFGILLSSLLLYLGEFRFTGMLYVTFRLGVDFRGILLTQCLIWLLPSVFFYLGALAFSKSKIRALDVFGTVAFAQLPMLPIAMLLLPKFMKTMITDLYANPASAQSYPAIVLTLLIFAIMLWMLILMFNALKTSCNVRGAKLWGSYLTGVLAGEFALRHIIAAAIASGVFFGASADSEAADLKPASSSAAVPASAVGSYEGVLDFGVQKLRLVLNIKEQNGEYSATFISPDQSNIEMVIPEFEIKKSKLSFAVPALGITFKGSLNNKFDTIRGTFTQRVSVPAVLKRKKEGK